jgi:hypothetical protein
MTALTGGGDSRRRRPASAAGTTESACSEPPALLAARRMAARLRVAWHPTAGGMHMKRGRWGGLLPIYAWMNLTL